MAVITWGQPRFTADVDTLVQLEHHKHASFVAALGAHGLDIDADALEDARNDRSHISVFDRASTFHVDIKLARTAEERAQIDAAHSVSLGDGRLRIATAEDTVAFKLLYGSPQDLQDARSIVWRQGDALDHDRLRRLAARLDVEDRLDALLAESGT